MIGRRLTVTAKARYRVSRETLYEAFVDPRYITRWLSPSDDIATEVLDFDLREGGRYRFGFRFADGHKNSVIGEYREISRPEWLVFTWTWEDPDPHAGVETLVTVEFTEQGDQTEVRVTHERFPNKETRDRHEEGWKGALSRLASLPLRHI